jgi:predicted DNA binding CopG/RHH family protein
MFYICMYDVFHFGIELALEVYFIMSKPLPRVKTDKAVKRILKKNPTDFISNENFKLTSFEFAPKDKCITLRVSTKLLDAVQSTAKQRGINYQKLIREAIEQFLKKGV